jgi:NhaP-type Na+/H+ or K+/H+ antiporter
LFYLVFGESVINDAVGVVLFNTFGKFVGYSHGIATVGIAIADFLLIFIGSFVIGYLVGCCAGLGSKYVNFHGNKLVEMSTYMLMM